MATHQIDILNSACRPDTSGLVWFEPYPIKAANDRWEHIAVVFENPGSTRNALFGTFIVPQNYKGGAKFVVIWSNESTTSANIELDVDYRCVQPENSESADQSGEDESLNTGDANIATVNILQKAELVATAANFKAGDLCEFLVARDGSDAGDTLGDSISAHAILFEYADA